MRVGVCEEGCKIARLQDSRGSSLPLNLLQHPVSFVHVVVAEKEDESGVDDLGSPAKGDIEAQVENNERDIGHIDDQYGQFEAEGSASITCARNGLKIDVSGD